MAPVPLRPRACPVQSMLDAAPASRLCNRLGGTRGKSSMTDPMDGLEGWSFEIDEVSAGVYWVRGVHADGRSVEATGAGPPDALLDRCRTEARLMGLKPRPVSR